MGLRLSMIRDRLCPAVRLVLSRTVSLNFFRLLSRGRRRPSANRYPKKSKPSSAALTTRVLVGCRLRPASAVHPLHHRQRRGCCLRATTQHHKVVRVAYHLKALL